MSGKTQKPFISVVIPAYNEDRSIENIIHDTKNVLEDYGKPYEIIVVDDGSVDLTGKIAATSGATVVQFNRNVGYGLALSAGLKKAQGEIIVTIDADGIFRPDDITRLIKPIQDGNADVVIGTRFSKDSNVRPHSISKIRYFAILLLTLSFSFLNGTYVSDALSSFRAIRKRDLEKFGLESQGSEIEVEIATKALTKGLRLKEVPVTYRTRYRSTSEIKEMADGLRVLKQMLRSLM